MDSGFLDSVPAPPDSDAFRVYGPFLRHYAPRCLLAFRINPAIGKVPSTQESRHSRGKSDVLLSRTPRTACWPYKQQCRPLSRVNGTDSNLHAQQRSHTLRMRILT